MPEGVVGVADRNPEVDCWLLANDVECNMDVEDPVRV